MTSAASALPLFVYGTLTDPPCVERVVGRALPATPARLPGWVRRAPTDGYPWVEPDPAATVEGFLLAVDTEALERLDAYEDEGRLYRRVRATALVGTERVSCFVYAGAGIARLPR